MQVSGHCINVRECSLMSLLVIMVPFFGSHSYFDFIKILLLNKLNVCGGGFKSINRKKNVILNTQLITNATCQNELK